MIKYLRPYIPMIAAAIVLVFLQCLTQLMLPDLMSKMVDNGIIGRDIDYIYKMGAYMLILTLFTMVFSTAANYFTSKSASGFAQDLRKDMFEKINSFSIKEVEKFGTSTLVTRTANDVSQIQTVIMMMLRVVVLSPLMFLGSFLLMLQKDVSLSLVVLSFLPLIGLFLYLVTRKIIPNIKKMQDRLDHLSRTLRERLTGVRVIRAFNKEETADRRYKEANEDLTEISLKVNKLAAFLFPGMMFLMNMATLAVLWFGGRQIESGDLSIGNLMAVIQYVTMIMMSAVMISFVFLLIPRAQVSVRRISEVLETKTTIRDPQNPADTDASQTKDTPAIEFKNVSFKYSDSEQEILKNISFTVAPGETVAVIGGTGSGKTTLVHLIPRFYDVCCGAVYVNGTDVRRILQTDLRQKIGFVPQTALLFSGTIAENIRYGKEEATEEEILKALETAQALDFVKEMENGIHSYISQGGTNVSGGQKQRLSIARAVVKLPEIYIFDDNFSALDYKTDANLRQALKSEMRGASAIIVAQRVSTIQNVSKIIVLKDGEIVGIGTDAQLRQNCGVYKKIAESQESTKTQETAESQENAEAVL